MRSLKGKNVLVMGLGLLGGGLSVTQWLLTQGAHVTVTDLKTRQQLARSITKISKKNVIFHLGEHMEEDFKNADLIIRNPGVPDDSPFLAIARKKKIPIHNEASLFFDIVKRPIIGVTGTRGKSTTSSIIYELLRQKYPNTIIAGNRGDVAMFSLVEEATRKTKDPIILELSSWQVEGLAVVSKSPHVAVLTNLFPDHLNRYKDIDSYYKAKRFLFAFQNKNDIAVFNAKNAASNSIIKVTKAKKIWFTNDEGLPKNVIGVFKRGEALIYQNKGSQKRIVDLNDTSLAGEHNEENIAAAVTVAREYDVSLKVIHDTLQSFKGIWGRQQLLGMVKGRMIINDTTASTPEGLLAFIKTHPGAVLIAGGNNKNLSYKEVVKKITDVSVKKLILLPGSATDVMLPALQKKKNGPKIVVVKTLKDAVAKAFTASSKGDKIALSPGATSFAEFNNEFERGKFFETYIKKVR